jgi:hypothetical protein
MTDKMTDKMKGAMGKMKPQSKIELYSGNYFAACTLGGIIGMLCNRTRKTIVSWADAWNHSLWSNTYHGYASRSGRLPKQNAYT